MRILRWKTLVGRHLPGEMMPTLMLGGVFVVCVAASVAGMGLDLGFNRFRVAGAAELGLAPAAIWALGHAFLSWTGVILTLVIAFFAFAHGRTQSAPEALIVTAAMLPAALAELIHGLSWFAPGEDLQDQMRIWSWLVARLVLAVALTAGAAIAVAVAGRRHGDRFVTLGSVASALAAASLLLLGGDAAPSMARGDGILVRPWDLLPLALFAFCGLVILPQLHRRHPSILSHTLILCTFPHCFAQLEAAFSLYPEDSHSMIAHFDVILGHAVLLTGLVFNYVHMQKSRQDAVLDFESAQVELRRVDRALVDQDLKRRRAERNLLILEKAVETMSLGVTVSDPDGRILYVNPADARMHGYTVEDLLGENAAIYSPYGSPPSEDSDSIYLHPWARERTNVTRDGRVFPVRLVSDMVRDNREKPIALVTLCEDISERKRIENALRRRDRILEAVGFAAERFLADASWEKSVEEVVESLRRATEVEHVRLVRIGELRRHRLDDTWSMLAANNLPKAVTLELPAGSVFPRWEHELSQGRLLRGKVRDLPEQERRELLERGVRSFVVVPIFVVDEWLGFLSLEDDDEERDWSAAELEVLRTAARTFGAALHRRQAEAALADSQAKFKDLLESASDLVQQVSPEGHFQFVNRAWLDSLGYNEEEVSELTLWDVVHPEHHKHCATVLRQVFRGQPIEGFEVAFLAKDGKELFLEGNLNARFVGDEPVATRGIFRDITERKFIDRMKSEFISTVSHELRTPLTSIIASLGLLQSGRLAEHPERSAELVTVAHRNSNRLLQLINDLLDLRKLAAGKMGYRFNTVDVRAVLDEALKGIQSLADSYTIELRLTDGLDGFEVWADRDRLIQVLNNLFSNAIKFSKPGDSVTVAAESTGAGVRISVADNGPGIPEEFRPRLFERFTQVDASATRSTGGSGLGLSIVKGLVEGMNGRISFETAPGQGTTFFVELPVPTDQDPDQRRQNEAVKSAAIA